MLLKIAVAFAVLILLFLGYVAMQPSEFKISREIKINAPSAIVFPLVNDVRTFDTWNPFLKMEPSSQKGYEGPPAGVGAKSIWDGPKTGKGTMTVIESVPNSLIKTRLDFEKPFKGTNYADFTFKDDGGGTLMTWTMSGHSVFAAKVFCAVMGGMDKMIGSSFEKGLNDLKTLAETKVSSNGS